MLIQANSLILNVKIRRLQFFIFAAGSMINWFIKRDSLRLTTLAGFCFQLNSNGSLKAQSAGKSGGVTVVLDAQVHLYSSGPASFSEGFSVSRVMPELI